MFQFGSYFNFESSCSSISDVCLRTCLIEFEFEFELSCEFEFALVDSFTKTFLITLLLLILDQKLSSMRFLLATLYNAHSKPTPSRK